MKKVILVLMFMFVAALLVAQQESATVIGARTGDGIDAQYNVDFIMFKDIIAICRIFHKSNICPGDDLHVFNCFFQSTLNETVIAQRNDQCENNSH